MTSILLVPGTRNGASLRGAVAAMRTRNGAAPRVVELAGPGAAGAGLREPSAIVERARAVGADLIALASALPADGGPLWMDADAVRVAARAEQAVLVFREGGAWPPRTAALPLDGEDAGAATLGHARRWLDTLFGAEGEGADGGPPELHVLHAAADMPRWYGMQGPLEAQLAELSEPRRVRLSNCMRFGAPPDRRILRWMDEQAPDLLVLGRPRTPAAGRATEPTWMRVLRGARGPVLLLPSGPGPAGTPRRDEDRFPWHQLAPLPSDEPLPAA